MTNTPVVSERLRHCEKSVWPLVGCAEMFCGNLKTAIKLFKSFRLLRPSSLPCLPAGRARRPRNDAHSVNKRTVTSLRKNQQSFCERRCFESCLPDSNLKAAIKLFKTIRLLRPPSLPCLPAGRARRPRNDEYSVNKRTATSLRKNQQSFCERRCFAAI